jgi:type IV secretion system protein VirB6
MGFFQTFWAWLDSQLAAYIGNNTARVAGALEPAIVTLGTVYVMVWGYLQLTGKIDEPFMTGVQRLLRLAVILGMTLHLWLYNALIVDTFYSAPVELASMVVTTPDPVPLLDAIWESGGSVGDQLWNMGAVLRGDPGFYLAGAAVWVLVGVLCVYTMFLLALSRLALSMLLALGPLFIFGALFDTTRSYFTAWLAQLVNYGLITILAALLAGLLLQIVQSYSKQTAALGSSITTVDMLNLALASGVVLLLMRQVMPVAAALAGGVTLSSMGAVSRTVQWGWRSLLGSVL